MSTPMDMTSTIFTWWNSELANKDDGAARGLSARLRRASGIVEVLSEEAVFGLGRELETVHHWRLKAETLACLAMTLAQVKENAPDSLASRCGEVLGETTTGKVKKKTRRLSESRMQRIIRIEDHMELAGQLRRALPIIDNSCNAGKLGRDFLCWTEQTKVRWLADYFGKAAPSASQTDPTHEATT